MKKFILLAIMAVPALWSCQKLPSTVDADGEFLVYTSHDESVDFSGFTTFSIADGLLVISSYDCDTLTNAFSDNLIAEYRQMMEDCGYTYVPYDGDNTDADLGIQLTYFSDTDYHVDYVDPYWWTGYPGYWSAGYWGIYGGAWYYPYPVTYEVTTHSLMAEMVDLTGPGTEDEKVPVVWSSVIDGNTGSTRSDLARFRTAIRQAFAQSSYLDRTSE